VRIQTRQTTVGIAGRQSRSARRASGRE